MQDDETEQLRVVALRNASSILIARQRAEQDLVKAKEELERKSAELAHSLARLKATLEATTDGILVLDSGNRVTDYNDNLLRMWHMKAPLPATTGERLLDSMSAQLVDPEAARRRLGDIVAAAAADTFDVIELADGRIFERTSRIQRVAGTATGRVWSFRDITATRRAEERLRDEASAAQRLSAERQQLLESERAARASAERMSQMKDEFLTNLSHELRTPLNAILGWATMLERGHRREADLDKGLETIERNARAQKQLIDDLLDVSRMISGKLRLDVQLLHPITFVEAALDTVRPAANAKGIRIERVLDGAAGPVSGDPDRLQQVTWNLLSNAIKFTPAGGKVQVRLERVGSHVKISVHDTGVGVAPEFLPHMFDRLSQADSSTTKRYSGLGLGLSIVKHLVELHGGSARAESAGVGLGTRVTVELPLAAERAHDDAAHSTREGPASRAAELSVTDLSGIHVLVVDHDADTRALMQRVLESCDARVSSAGSVDEALQRLGRERADVLISEVGTSGVDGYDLLRRVRALGLLNEAAGPGARRTAAVALTAFARSEDGTRALRAGFLIHLAKPIEPSELVATVASVCGRSQP